MTSIFVHGSPMQTVNAVHVAIDLEHHACNESEEWHLCRHGLGASGSTGPWGSAASLAMHNMLPILCFPAEIV